VVVVREPLLHAVCALRSEETGATSGVHVEFATSYTEPSVFVPAEPFTLNVIASAPEEAAMAQPTAIVFPVLARFALCVVVQLLPWESVNVSASPDAFPSNARTYKAWPAVTFETKDSVLEKFDVPVELPCT
jgi:hypothetical protein